MNGVPVRMFNIDWPCGLTSVRFRLSASVSITCLHYWDVVWAPTPRCTLFGDLIEGLCSCLPRLAVFACSPSAAVAWTSNGNQKISFFFIVILPNPKGSLQVTAEEPKTTAIAAVVVEPFMKQLWKECIWYWWGNLSLFNLRMFEENQDLCSLMHSITVEGGRVKCFFRRYCQGGGDIWWEEGAPGQCPGAHL